MNSNLIKVVVAVASGLGLTLLHAKESDVVRGTYFDNWSPLGLTTEGFSFSTGFRLAGGFESAPVICWKKKGEGDLVEVKSLASGNLVLQQAAGGGSTEELVDRARRLSETRIASTGPTGLPLTFRSPDQARAVADNFRAAGMGRDALALFLSLAHQFSQHIDERANAWQCTWCEIDYIGAVERVTIEGTVAPFGVTTTARQLIHGRDTFDHALLRRDIFLPPPKYK